MSLAVGASSLLHGGNRTKWAHPNRLFVVTLFVSVAAHLALLVIAPGVRRTDVSPPRTLEVVIVRPPVPQPMKPPPRIVAEVAPPVPRTPVRRAQDPQPTPAPAREQERVLALPQAAPSAPPTFTVPQAPAEPTAAPQPAEAKPGVAAPAPTAPARESAASVPPSFNAAYLRNAPPRYPMLARRNGIEGTVRLKVLVTQDGRAAQVLVDQTSGSPALDSAALEAVRKWQFVPARRGQEAIESWVLVPLVFKLEAAS